MGSFEEKNRTFERIEHTRTHDKLRLLCDSFHSIGKFWIGVRQNLKAISALRLNAIRPAYWSLMRGSHRIRHPSNGSVWRIRHRWASRTGWFWGESSVNPQIWPSLFDDLTACFCFWPFEHLFLTISFRPFDFDGSVWRMTDGKRIRCEPGLSRSH